MCHWVTRLGHGPFNRFPSEAISKPGRARTPAAPKHGNTAHPECAPYRRCDGGGGFEIASSDNRMENCGIRLVLRSRQTLSLAFLDDELGTMTGTLAKVFTTSAIRPRSSLLQGKVPCDEMCVCLRECFLQRSSKGASCRLSFSLLPAKTCRYYLRIGNAFQGGRSSLHGFPRR